MTLESTSTSVLDGYTCLVLSGRWSGRNDPGGSGWTAGPLPVPVPPVPGAETARAVVADRAARGVHFSPRVHDALYGSTSPGARTVRWHRSVDASAGPQGAVAEAAELLLTSTGDALAVVHVQLAGDPVAGLATLTAAAGEGRDWLAALLSPDVVLTADRARAVTHLSWEGEPPGLPAGLPERLPQPPDREAAKPALDWWAWYLAAGVTPEAFVPDVDGQDWTQGRVRLSQDWSALVLRDGLSFVARTPRASSGGSDFHASGQVYARTLHVDVLLLGILQRTALHHVADSVAALDFEELDAGALEEMERELLQFRIGLWWDDVGQRGRQTSAVLLAFQEQHRMPALYEQLVQDLTDLSRYWKAREAAELEDARHAEERRERRVGSAITVVSFFLLPLTVVYTAAAVIAEPGWPLFWWSTAAGAGLCLLVAVGAWLWRRGAADGRS